MTKSGNLWAVGYDDMGRADQVRDEIINLGWNKHYLELDDVAVVVRHPDGSFTSTENIPGRVQRPGLQRGGIGCGPGGWRPADRRGRWCHGGRRWLRAVLASVGIGDDFVREVKELMKPGTSAIFVLDDEGDMDVILPAIRGLGGTVLKTNVDLERAQLIQSTLAAPSHKRANRTRSTV